jgi:hypothetical protein
VGKKRQALSYQEIVYLKRIYRVSAAALVYRLKDLEVIPEEAMTYIFQSIGRTWRRAEPEPLEKSQVYLEQPFRFQRLCYWALAEKLISPAKAAELLKLPIEKVQLELRGPGCVPLGYGL